VNKIHIKEEKGKLDFPVNEIHIKEEKGKLDFSTGLTWGLRQPPWTPPLTYKRG
jgi:hypothetical protein